MSKLKLKNVFFNDSTESKHRHIFDEVNEDLKDHPISSVKNLKKYFQIVAKKFAENLNCELTQILNHPNVLDYKHISFQPHSRSEYKNEKHSSFYYLDCKDTESITKDDSALTFKLYFNIPINQLPEEILTKMFNIFYWHVEEIKMHILCPTTKKTLYTYFLNKKNIKILKLLLKLI